MEENKGLEKIISFSGNDLQVKVEGLLVEAGWDCDIGPSYNDSATGISREIDIVASKSFGDFHFKLFIECKVINKPFLFWFGEKNIKEAINLAKENAIFRQENGFSLKDDSVLPHKTHHYIVENPVTSSWDYAPRESTKGKEKKGVDLFFEAYHQALNALVFFRNLNYDDTTVYLPLILIDSFKNINKREPAPENHSRVENNFQIEKKHSFIENIPTGGKIDRSNYFLIDVVSFEKLKDFLKNLEDNDIALMSAVSYHNKIQNEIKRRQIRKPIINQAR